MTIPFVDLAAEHAALQSKIEREVLRVMRSGEYILGNEVGAFEKAFASFCHGTYCVGVANGTDGLLIALRSIGVGQGDEVITVSHTFIATSLAITYTGATPKFVDIRPDTCNMDETRIEKMITKRTKAILPVALYGQAPNLSAIRTLARKYKLQVILDACQAHGALHRGKSICDWADVTVFSFYPTKNLGAYGDGGAIVTNSKKIADTVRLFRNVGRTQWYTHTVKGYNSRLDNLQAAILRVKLTRLPGVLAKKRALAAAYTKLLDGTVVRPVHEEPYNVGVYYLYVVRTKQRANLMTYLLRKGIHTAIHYPLPIHLQPAYKDLGHKKGDYPESEKAGSEVLSLPFFPTMTKRQQDVVANAIRTFSLRG